MCVCDVELNTVYPRVEYVCLAVCMHMKEMRMYICLMYVCIHACVCARLCACACVYVLMYARMNACMYVYVCPNQSHGGYSPRG